MKHLILFIWASIILQYTSFGQQQNISVESCEDAVILIAESNPDIYGETHKKSNKLYLALDHYDEAEHSYLIHLYGNSADGGNTYTMGWYKYYSIQNTLYDTMSDEDTPSELKINKQLGKIVKEWCK